MVLNECFVGDEHYFTEHVMRKEFKRDAVFLVEMWSSAPLVAAAQHCSSNLEKKLWCRVLVIYVLE